MILVDTSVWIDHFRRGDALLERSLEQGAVLAHPFVIGELACGNLGRREVVLDLLRQLPAALAADDEEVLGFIDRHDLHGQGIGLVDVHLLASTLLTEGARLWTRDRRLLLTAVRLDCGFHEVASR